MNICKKEHFGPVTAFKMGYGPLGPPLMSVYMYVVDSVAIDSAQRHMRKEVLELLKEHPVDKVLLTHHHEDHSGNASDISRTFSAEVFGHQLTADKMKGPLRILPYQHLVWGKAARINLSFLPESIETDNCRFLPIHTPGHSKDHTVYLETKNGWLFSGDLFLGERIKFFRSDEKIEDQIDSLKTVLGLDFDGVFCGHHPIPKKGKSKIAAKLAFLEDLNGAVKELKREGLSEAAIISKIDQKHDRLIKWITMGNVSFANMVRSAFKT